jgi:RNA polymerase sigma factor (sigma-70 family)
MAGDPSLTNSTGSAELVLRFQIGDDRALERLWERYLPRLKKWGHGRLPRTSQNAADTDDLIQDSFVRSLAHLRTLKPRGAQSLFAYFKRIILNQVRDFIRQSARRRVSPLGESDVHPDAAASPLEEMIGNEVLESYQRALGRLSENDQDIVLAVVELGCSDAELAELFEKSPDAARMARGRALARLARAMESHGPGAALGGRS